MHNTTSFGVCQILCTTTALLLHYYKHTLNWLKDSPKVFFKKKFFLISFEIYFLFFFIFHQFSDSPLVLLQQCPSSVLTVSQQCSSSRLTVQYHQSSNYQSHPSSQLPVKVRHYVVCAKPPYVSSSAVVVQQQVILT